MGETNPLVHWAAVAAFPRRQSPGAPMASSPPSFDHLPSASAAEREPYAGYPIQAQICRNGQMKYQRTRAPTSDNEIVMADREIVCAADYVGGTRDSAGCPGRRSAGAVGGP